MPKTIVDPTVSLPTYHVFANTVASVTAVTILSVLAVLASAMTNSIGGVVVAIFGGLAVIGGIGLSYVSTKAEIETVVCPE